MSLLTKRLLLEAVSTHGAAARRVLAEMAHYSVHSLPTPVLKKAQFLSACINNKELAPLPLVIIEEYGQVNISLHVLLSDHPPTVRTVRKVPALIDALIETTAAEDIPAATLALIDMLIKAYPNAREGVVERAIQGAFNLAAEVLHQCDA